MTLNQFYEELEQKYQKGDRKELEAFLARYAEDSMADRMAGGTSSGEIVSTSGESGGTSDAESADSLQMAACNELGSFYRNLGSAEQAVEYFRRALRHAARICGPATAEYATVVNNLAGAYRMVGDLAGAVSCFKEALGIYEKVMGRGNFYYTSALNNLALVYIDSQEYEQAEEMLNQALNVTERTPQMEMEQAISLNNMAVLRIRQSREDEASDLLEQAISLFETLPEEKTMHLAAACNAMGDILLHRGQTDQAEKMYIKSKEITYRFFGKNLEYAIVCKKLALIRSKKEDQIGAEALMTEASECMERIGLNGLQK